MNSFQTSGAWIIFHLTLTLWPFLEVVLYKHKERCIYRDFGDIRLNFSSNRMTFYTLLSSTLYKDKEYSYTTKDILRADRWLSVMKILGTLSFFFLIFGIIPLIIADSIFPPYMNMGKIVNINLFPILYALELIFFSLRIKSKVVRILKCFHPKYTNVSFISIVTFKYLKK